MDLKTNTSDSKFTKPPGTTAYQAKGSLLHDDYDFSLGNYSYELVTANIEKEVFNKLVYNNFYEAIKLEKLSSEYSEIISKSKDLDKKLDKSIIRIIAYNKNREAIGTICAYLDHKKLLPGEIKESCNYSDLRKLCTIMEVGRLSIRKDYRLKPLLSCGLILFVIDVAIKNNVDVFIESSFPDKIYMFIRIGFHRFKDGDSYDQIYKIPKVLCYYNFASKLYGYFNKQNNSKHYELSSYNRRIFELAGDKRLRNAYEMMIKRNSAKPGITKTFNLDYSNINISTSSSFD